MECPLNFINLIGFRIDNHTMEIVPSFPDLQAIFKGGNDIVDPPLQSAQRRPWNPRA